MTAWLPGHDSIKAAKESSKAEKDVEKQAAKEAEKSGKKPEKGKKLKGIAKNTADSFGEELAGSVKTWFSHTQQLKDAKWDQICSASEVFLADIAKAGAGPALKDVLKTPGSGSRVMASVNMNDDVLILSD